MLLASTVSRVTLSRQAGPSQEIVGALLRHMLREGRAAQQSLREPFSSRSVDALSALPPWVARIAAGFRAHPPASILGFFQGVQIALLVGLIVPGQAVLLHEPMSLQYWHEAMRALAQSISATPQPQSHAASP